MWTLLTGLGEDSESAGPAGLMVGLGLTGVCKLQYDRGSVFLIVNSSRSADARSNTERCANFNNLILLNK
jgi:hypothetical protein